MSFRSLKCLLEFAKLVGRLKAAQSKEEISSAYAELKPFKSALTDLLSMAKAANNRCNDAAKSSVKKKQDDGKRKADDDSKTRLRKRRKTPGTAPAVATFMEQKHTLALEIPVVRCDGELRLSQALQWSDQKPVIVRFWPELVTDGVVAKDIQAFAEK